MSTWTYQMPPVLSDEQYARWQLLLEDRTGIHFSQHKSILQQGLGQRMREVGIDDYELYFQQIMAAPAGMAEWSKLIDHVSVKDTRFFREPESLAVVGRYLRQRFAKQTRGEPPLIDIWSVGCSTGEEAYSLAITADEVMSYLAVQGYWGVVATDISHGALATAKQGVYAARKLSLVKPVRKKRYFLPQGADQYRVADSLRQGICFVQDNLLELDTAPKVPVDIIYCQNVLIYFCRRRQYQVLNALVEHLKPGGLMVLGAVDAPAWTHPSMNRNADYTVKAFIKH